MPRPEFTELLARSLPCLDRSAHGRFRSDGIDELTTTGYTKIRSAATAPSTRSTCIRPTSAAEAPPGALQGGDAHENARIIENILDGGAATRDVVLLNSGARCSSPAPRRRWKAASRSRHARSIAATRSGRSSSSCRSPPPRSSRRGRRMTESTLPAADLLATIVAATRRIVEVRQARADGGARAARGRAAVARRPFSERDRRLERST